MNLYVFFIFISKNCIVFSRSKDNLSLKDRRTNKSFIEDAISDLANLSCNEIPEKEVLENPTIKDDRPPLPEKKKNLLSRNEEIKIAKNVDIPLSINSTDVIENEPPVIQPEFSQPIVNKSIDSTESIHNDSMNISSETHSENVETLIEPLQKESIDTDQNVSMNIQQVHEKIIKLQTRPYLPEEIHWNKLWPVLLHSLPDGHIIQIIICKYFH